MTNSHLGENAEIILNKSFVSALQKILNNRQSNLTAEELLSVSGLQVTRNALEETVEEELSMAARALKRQCISQNVSNFLDVRFIVPTSNMCERLFSEAGHGLNSRRMHTILSNFESQMFLHTNKAF